MKENSTSSLIELMPLFNLVLYFFLITILLFQSISFDVEQAEFIQTVTFSFIAVNIALLLFVLPILSSKRRQVLQTKLKALQLTYNDEESVKIFIEESDQKMMDLTHVINMIVTETICSFLILIISVFVTIFVDSMSAKSALQISALTVQITYFLNMILWLCYIYWKSPNIYLKKINQMDNSVRKKDF